MKVSLIVAQGKHEGKVIPIEVSEFIIGRHSKCQLRAASPAVGKHHCAILVRRRKVLLRDFDSVNGTFVNEQKVEGERELHNEDCLQVGPLTFLVWIEAGKPGESSLMPSLSGVDAGTDESAIARLLLGSARNKPTLGILGAGDESGYGSTIMKDRSKMDADKKAVRKRKSTPPSAASGSAAIPGFAKEAIKRHKQKGKE